MALEYPNRLAAAGVVAVDGQGGTAVFARQRGFLDAIIYNGVGDYTLTVDREIFPGSAAFPEITVLDVGYASTDWTGVDQSAFRVLLSDNAGAAVDASFSAMVWDVAEPG